MLSYKETYDAIVEIERAIRDMRAEESGERAEYPKHLERLLSAYIVEHRRAAEREKENAMR